MRTRWCACVPHDRRVGKHYNYTNRPLGSVCAFSIKKGSERRVKVRILILQQSLSPAGVDKIFHRRTLNLGCGSGGHQPRLPLTGDQASRRDYPSPEYCSLCAHAVDGNIGAVWLSYFVTQPDPSKPKPSRIHPFQPAACQAVAFCIKVPTSSHSPSIKTKTRREARLRKNEEEPKDEFP